MAILPGKERENVSYGGKSMYDAICDQAYPLIDRRMQSLCRRPL